MKFCVILLSLLACVGASKITMKKKIEPSIKGRITNGQMAKPGQLPYQVGLAFRLSSGSSWCGGSLIHSRWVLTAAHCVQDLLGVTVYLGSIHRLRPQLSYNVYPSEVYQHEHYYAQSVQNDIALIQLPAFVKYTDTISPVNLPSGGYQSYVGLTALVSGWGRFSDSLGSISNLLQYAALQISTAKVCANTYGSYTFTRNNICAATPDYVSTCQGDSGGPLVLDDALQIGIVSYGSPKGCAQGFPVAFTRVSSFIPWIEAITGLSF